MSENRKKIVIYSQLAQDHGWIRAMGAKLGLEVFVVQDGALAIEKCQAESPGFALLDVSMPAVSGIDCCVGIKQASVDTKVILISTVHSLSLQDGAKQAKVDLFIVDTIASVKVPEFIEASLSKKELPPEAAEEIEREVLSKRGAHRFPFEGEVQYQMEGNWNSGVLVNVSQDGLLFQTAFAIPLGTNLILSWMDHGLEHIEVTAIVVRQFSSPHPQYPFLIGVQFLKSSPILDEKIAQLSDEIDVFQEGSEIELDLDLIEQLLSNRGTYFRDLFQGGKAPLFLEFSIADVVEHERNAFQNKDEYSICMQEIVSSRIICQLIENSANQIAAMKSPKNFPTRLLTLTSELLEKIEFVEDDSDAIVKKSIQEGMVNERRLINESNSRLYQAKASVLDTFCKKIKRTSIPESHVGGYDEIVKQNKQIESYQDHLDEIAKQEEQERKKMAINRITKPTEKTVATKPEQQAKPKNQFSSMKNESYTGDKKPLLPYVAAIVLMLALIPWVDRFIQIKFMSNDLKLVVNPTSVERKSDGKLIVGLTKEAWEQLGDRGRELILDQIEIYLTKKQLHQCKIVDGDQVIAAVYGTISKENPGFLHRVFLNPPEPLAQPKFTEPAPIIQQSELEEKEEPTITEHTKQRAPAQKKKPKHKKKK